MFLRLQDLAAKLLIGHRLRMSFADDRTFELWSGFMPDRKKITNTCNEDLISMQVYPTGYDFARFDVQAAFDKWAAVEVTDFNDIPGGMQRFEIPRGLYAVFLHKGTPADAPKTFGYIFGQWLPNSDYQSDDRPYFEVLGERYKHGSADSEEEIFIPIRPK